MTFYTYEFIHKNYENKKHENVTSGPSYLRSTHCFSCISVCVRKQHVWSIVPSSSSLFYTHTIIQQALYLAHFVEWLMVTMAPLRFLSLYLVFCNVLFISCQLGEIMKRLETIIAKREVSIHFIWFSLSP